MAEFSDIRYDDRVLKEANTLSGAGYSVRLVMYNADSKRSQIIGEQSGGLTKFSIPFQKRYYSRTRWQRFIRGFAFVSVFAKYFGRIMTLKADYYHAHNFYVGWIVLLSCIIHRGKFVFDVHEIIWEESGFVYRVGVKIDRLLLSKASLVIAPSDDRARLISEYHHLPELPMALYNYPRADATRSAVTNNLLKQELSLGDDNRILCYSGMLSVKTRLQDNVIKALRSVPETVVMVLIGFGHPGEIALLEETARQYGVSDRVFILGPKPHSVLLQYTRCCDIGISLLKNNGVAFRYHALNKFYEYAASGLAVLASDFPTFRRDIYENSVGRIGSTCHEEDPSSISEAIREMIGDESRLSTLKRNALKAFREHWNWEMQQGRLVAAYNRL